MRGYKAFRQVAEHRLVVGLLLRLALEGHTKCAGKLARALRYALDDSPIASGEAS
jgi:hypothetical protein